MCRCSILIDLLPGEVNIGVVFGRVVGSLVCVGWVVCGLAEVVLTGNLCVGGAVLGTSLVLATAPVVVVIKGTVLTVVASSR